MLLHEGRRSSRSTWAQMALRHDEHLQAAKHVERTQALAARQAAATQHKAASGYVRPALAVLASSTCMVPLLLGSLVCFSTVTPAVHELLFRRHRQPASDKCCNSWYEVDIANVCHIAIMSRDM